MTWSPPHKERVWTPESESKLRVAVADKGYAIYPIGTPSKDKVRALFTDKTVKSRGEIFIDHQRLSAHKVVTADDMRTIPFPDEGRNVPLRMWTVKMGQLVKCRDHEGKPEMRRLIAIDYDGNSEDVENQIKAIIERAGSYHAITEGGKFNPKASKKVCAKRGSKGITYFATIRHNWQRYASKIEGIGDILYFKKKFGEKQEEYEFSGDDCFIYPGIHKSQDEQNDYQVVGDILFETDPNDLPRISQLHLCELATISNDVKYMDRFRYRDYNLQETIELVRALKSGDGKGDGGDFQPNFSKVFKIGSFSEAFNAPPDQFNSIEARDWFGEHWWCQVRKVAEGLSGQKAQEKIAGFAQEIHTIEGLLTKLKNTADSNRKSWGQQFSTGSGKKKLSPAQNLSLNWLDTISKAGDDAIENLACFAGGIHRWTEKNSWEALGDDQWEHELYNFMVDPKDVSNAKKILVARAWGSEASRVLRQRIWAQDFVEMSRFAVRNGVFTRGIKDGVDTMIFKDGQKGIKEDYIINNLDINFNPRAKCPKIWKHLDHLFDGRRDDIRNFLEYIGWCLIPTVEFRRGLILYGRSTTGKTTLGNMLIKFFNSGVPDGMMGNCSSVDIMNFDNPNSLASMSNALINICTEMGEKNPNKIASSAFKSISGGDSVEVKILYKDVQQITMLSRQIHIGNRMPVFQGVDQEAMRERLIILRTTENMVKDNQNRRLKYEMSTKEEMEGFLALIVRSLNRLLRRGRFKLSRRQDEAARKATPTVQVFEDFVESGWVQIQEEESDTNDWVINSHFYTYFQEWLARSQYRNERIHYNDSRVKELYQKYAQRTKMPKSRISPKSINGSRPRMLPFKLTPPDSKANQSLTAVTFDDKTKSAKAQVREDDDLPF